MLVNFVYFYFIGSRNSCFSFLDIEQKEDKSMLLESPSKCRNKLGVQLDIKFKLSERMSDIQYLKAANHHKPSQIK